MALRCVHQVYRGVGIPIIGVGGIMTIDDCMEFFVAGAAAVQIGTASFAEPVVSARLLAALPAALREAGASRFADLVGTHQLLGEGVAFHDLALALLQQGELQPRQLAAQGGGIHQHVHILRAAGAERQLRRRVG